MQRKRKPHQKDHPELGNPEAGDPDFGNVKAEEAVQKPFGGAAFDPSAHNRPSGDQARDVKHRVGQYGGKGEPPLMKK